MRKHFLILMLLTLLPLAGWAQFSVGNYVPKGDFIYQITQAAAGDTPGKVIVFGIREGRNPVDETTKALNLEGKITIGIIDGPSFDFVVDYAQNSDVVGESQALRKTYTWVDYNTIPTEVGAFAGMVTAESVVIPKEFLQIKENTFYGYTNMKSISFEEGSQVKTIKSGAFNTTQISEFDFRYCSKLEEIEGGLFVEGGDAVNSYVKNVWLPEESEALVSIGTAFQRLPNLEHIYNLDKSLITTVEQDAFKGDTQLKTLAFPATVVEINANAFRGSSVENLTIDVTSLDDDTEGNVYGAGADLTTLKYLTLKGVLSGTFKPGAFAGCANLESVTMNDATKPFVITGGTIGANAFKGCTSLATLAFNDITNGTIDASAFDGCTKLGSISFGDLDNVNFATKAFANCYGATVSGTSIPLSFGNIKDVTFADGAAATGAFYNCYKLRSIKFAAEDGQTIENLTIGTYTFAGSATNSSASLEFGDATNILIKGNAFKGCTRIESIKFGDIMDDGTVVDLDEIAASAFEGCTGLKELTFGNLTGVEILADAFKDATAATLSTNTSATAQFGKLDASTIEAKAFDGCASLETVKIGDVVNGSVIGDGTNPVFGSVLKTVTVGSVSSTATLATSIGVKAFTFANGSGATLNLAAGENEYLEDLTPAATPLVAAGAFDFSAVVEAAGRTYPVITIGELKSANTMAPGALKGDEIAEITFAGNIAAGALNAMIVEATCKVATLTFRGNIAAGGIAANTFAALPALATITFNGEIEEGGIAKDAFKNLASVATITFNGKMATAAVANGAFEGLKNDSQVIYAYDDTDIDLTVNPFHKQAFKNDAAVGDGRIIKFAVTNAALKAKYQDATTGLLTNGAFGIYLAYFFVPVETDLSFLVYPQLYASSTTAASPRTAWARWELGARVAEGVTGTLAAGTNLVIKRVQKIDGTNNAKITIYGTYTDEDDAMETATVYMVPLKAENGYYHIPGTNKTTLIVKVENNGADFAETSYKVECNHDDAVAELDWPDYNANVCTGVAAAANGSIWPGLVNKELYVASNIMTNQQLIDKQATDAANATDASGVYGYYHAARTKSGDVTSIDIYRGGATIAEDLYIMSDPSKNKGFRIDKTPITNENNAYINTGWYYMLLKKYDNAAAAAHVVWMDDATEGEITGILTVKDNAKNVAAKSEGIYTLQGVRVSEMQKGNIYIVNGKKYIAK